MVSEPPRQQLRTWRGERRKGGGEKDDFFSFPWISKGMNWEGGRGEKREEEDSPFFLWRGKGQRETGKGWHHSSNWLDSNQCLLCISRWKPTQTFWPC